jgi:hypothetical protein
VPTDKFKTPSPSFTPSNPPLLDCLEVSEAWMTMHYLTDSTARGHATHKAVRAEMQKLLKLTARTEKAAAKALGQQIVKDLKTALKGYDYGAMSKDSAVQWTEAIGKVGGGYWSGALVTASQEANAKAAKSKVVEDEAQAAKITADAAAAKALAELDAATAAQKVAKAAHAAAEQTLVEATKAETKARVQKEDAEKALAKEPTSEALNQTATALEKAYVAAKEATVAASKASASAKTDLQAADAAIIAKQTAKDSTAATAAQKDEAYKSAQKVHKVNAEAAAKALTEKLGAIAIKKLKVLGSWHMAAKDTSGNKVHGGNFHKKQETRKERCAHGKCNTVELQMLAAETTRQVEVDVYDRDTGAAQSEAAKVVNAINKAKISSDAKILQGPATQSPLEEFIEAIIDEKEAAKKKAAEAAKASEPATKTNEGTTKTDEGTTKTDDKTPSSKSTDTSSTSKEQAAAPTSPASSGTDNTATILLGVFAGLMCAFVIGLSVYIVVDKRNSRNAATANALRGPKTQDI